METKKWCVLYRDKSSPPFSPPECFVAAVADDSDHAEEQCQNAYPGCAVLWTYPGEPDEAYADYWGIEGDCASKPKGDPNDGNTRT